MTKKQVLNKWKQNKRTCNKIFLKFMRVEKELEKLKDEVRKLMDKLFITDDV